MFTDKKITDDKGSFSLDTLNKFKQSWYALGFFMIYVGSVTIRPTYRSFVLYDVIFYWHYKLLRQPRIAKSSQSLLFCLNTLELLKDN